MCWSPKGKRLGSRPAKALGEDLLGLRELLVYGIKGLAAYADHAAILGQEDDAIYQFVHEAMAATLNPDVTVDEYVGLALKCGEVNVRAMELLDAGNTGTYGHPVPTKVPLGRQSGQSDSGFRP